MFGLVVDIPSSDIGSLYWHKQQQYAASRIVKMSDNGASTVLVVTYLLIKAWRGLSRS